MAWVRIGDTAATYPKLMSVLGFPGADERTVNELFGFIVRLAIQSGGHLTDYVVDTGTCFMLGGPRTQELISLGVKAGRLEPVRTSSGQCVKLVDDPDFIHLRLRKEKEWEQIRRNDNRDMRLLVPVRKRDGDQCRYCGVVVHWRGRKSNRKATYDHVVPGEKATVDTFVVACLRCNSSRQDNPQWDDDHPLLDPPEVPKYSKWTAQFLTEGGYPTEANLLSTDPSAGGSGEATSVRENAPGTIDQGASVGHQADPGTPSQSASVGPWANDPGTSGTGASEGPLHAAPAGSAQNISPLNGEKVDLKVNSNIFPCPPKKSFAGSGRDGTFIGRDGSGSVGHGRDRDGSGSVGAGVAGSGRARRFRVRRRR